MGNSDSLVRYVPASGSPEALDRLIDLVKLDTLIGTLAKEPSTDSKLVQIVGPEIVVNHLTPLPIHEKDTLLVIIEKQKVFAEKIDNVVKAAKARISEETRKKARVVAHFNDGDGDDIKFIMEGGVSRGFINGTETPVRVVSAVPPVLCFEYNTGNKWTWTVNFDSRRCNGVSPRTFVNKSLSAILTNESLIFL